MESEGVLRAPGKVGQARLGIGADSGCFNPSKAAPLSPYSLVTIPKEEAWEGQGLGGRPTYGAEVGLG